MSWLSSSAGPPRWPGCSSPPRSWSSSVPSGWARVTATGRPGRGGCRWCFGGQQRLAHTLVCALLLLGPALLSAIGPTVTAVAAAPPGGRRRPRLDISRRGESHRCPVRPGSVRPRGQGRDRGEGSGGEHGDRDHHQGRAAELVGSGPATSGCRGPLAATVGAQPRSPAGRRHGPVQPEHAAAGRLADHRSRPPHSTHPAAAAPPVAAARRRRGW